MGCQKGLDGARREGGLARDLVEQCEASGSMERMQRGVGSGGVVVGDGVDAGADELQLTEGRARASLACSGPSREACRARRHQPVRRVARSDAIILLYGAVGVLRGAHVDGAACVGAMARRETPIWMSGRPQQKKSVDELLARRCSNARQQTYIECKGEQLLVQLHHVERL